MIVRLPIEFALLQVTAETEVFGTPMAVTVEESTAIGKVLRSPAKLISGFADINGERRPIDVPALQQIREGLKAQDDLKQLYQDIRAKPSEDARATLIVVLDALKEFVAMFSIAGGSLDTSESTTPSESAAPAASEKEAPSEAKTATLEPLVPVSAGVTVDDMLLAFERQQRKTYQSYYVYVEDLVAFCAESGAQFTESDILTALEGRENWTRQGRKCLYGTGEYESNPRTLQYAVNRLKRNQGQIKGSMDYVLSSLFPNINRWNARMMLDDLVEKSPRYQVQAVRVAGETRLIYLGN